MPEFDRQAVDGREFDLKKDFVTNNAKTAYKWLKMGKILAYPTESVWGLGCDAFNKAAVQNLLTLKNRPIDKGLIVITASELYLQDFLKNLPTSRQDEIIKSWQTANDRQQATTWLFPATHLQIPTWITGNHNSLAIRVINYPKIAKVCDLMATNGKNPYGFLVSTSCNVGGQPPALDFDTAYRYFGSQVCYLVGDTLGYPNPSQIKSAMTGDLVRL